MPIRPRTAVAFGLALALPLASCGGGGTEASDEEPTTTTTAAADPGAPDAAAAGEQEGAADDSAPVELSPEEAAGSARLMGFAEDDEGNTVVLASQDGVSWTELGSLDLPNDARILANADGTRILAHVQSGRGYSVAPYASDDRGLTWTQLAGPEGVPASTVIVPVATVGDEWFAHDSGNGTVYVSADGTTWEVAAQRDDVFQGSLYGDGDQLMLVPNTGDSLMPSSVFTSSDGREWDEVPTSFDGEPDGFSIAAATHDGERWILADATNRIWASDGDTLDFTVISELRGYSMVTSMAVVDDLVVVVQQNGTTVSEDGGETWVRGYDFGGEVVRDLTAVHALS